MESVGVRHLQKVTGWYLGCPLHPHARLRCKATTIPAGPCPRPAPQPRAALAHGCSTEGLGWGSTPHPPKNQSNPVTQPGPDREAVAGPAGWESGCRLHCPPPGWGDLERPCALGPSQPGPAAAPVLAPRLCLERGWSRWHPQLRSAPLTGVRLQRMKGQNKSLGSECGKLEAAQHPRGQACAQDRGPCSGRPLPPTSSGAGPQGGCARPGGTLTEQPVAFLEASNKQPEKEEATAAGRPPPRARRSWASRGPAAGWGETATEGAVWGWGWAQAWTGRACASAPGSRALALAAATRGCNRVQPGPAAAVAWRRAGGRRPPARLGGSVHLRDLPLALAPVCSLPPPASLTPEGDPSTQGRSRAAWKTPGSMHSSMHSCPFSWQAPHALSVLPTHWGWQCEGSCRLDPRSHQLIARIQASAPSSRVTQGPVCAVGKLKGADRCWHESGLHNSSTSPPRTQLLWALLEPPRALPPHRGQGHNSAAPLPAAWPCLHPGTPLPGPGLSSALHAAGTSWPRCQPPSLTLVRGLSAAHRRRGCGAGGRGISQLKANSPCYRAR